MKNFAEIFVLFAFLGAACSTTEFETGGITKINSGIPAPISSIQALAVVGTSTKIGDSILQCVENALHKEAPNLKIVPYKKFRNSMFPWFEPRTAPTSAEELTELFAKPIVLTRIDELKVRYVVAIGGGTQTSEEGWGGVVGGPHGAVLIVGADVNKQTSLDVKVLDLELARPIAETKVTARGQGGFGLIVLIPYVSIPQTESVACKKLAEQITTIFE
jgi:hypothetical protein